MTISPHRESLLKQEQERLEADARFLWYEFTPYEIGCDEIGGKSSLFPSLILYCFVW